MQLQAINIIPRMGACPLSHMGHAYDLKPTIENLSILGTCSYVNISPNKVFEVHEQWDVIAKQWDTPNVAYKFFSSVGNLLYNIVQHHSFEKVNIVVGQDRIDLAERVKYGIENNTFKEVTVDLSKCGVEIHVAETFREHGFSGTYMREAAVINDRGCFKAHLGEMFTDEEVDYYMERTAKAIFDGVIPLKRR